MTEISVDWTYEYNTLNQLKKRYDGASWSGADGDTRWSYEYDKNGNLTKSTKQEKASGTWGEKLRFEYDWNPRDQMERVDKFVNGAAIPVGYVVYRYCLFCDGALSERIEHGAYYGGSHPIVSWQRYEYHGLDLARVDERYDTSGGSITSGDPWRTLEVSSHRPGAIGSLLGKRVYTHTNNDATPDDTEDFFYTYDPVGNVVSVMDDNGDEVYYFTQEAFGNELAVNVLGGSDWDGAADDRIVEHQTGKWMDPFTGDYYFSARWYDAAVGRFVGRVRP